MHAQGQAEEPSNPRGMPATDDEIREKYLERAIRELNAFSRDLQSCTQCPRGALMPVLGSGHPQADIFLVKYSARPSEVEEGVAFYGRTGNALMKSLKRLSIDPLAGSVSAGTKPEAAFATPTGIRYAPTQARHLNSESRRRPMRQRYPGAIAVSSA